MDNIRHLVHLMRIRSHQQEHDVLTDLVPDHPQTTDELFDVVKEAGRWEELAVTAEHFEQILGVQNTVRFAQLLF